VDEETGVVSDKDSTTPSPEEVPKTVTGLRPKKVGFAPKPFRAVDERKAEYKAESATAYIGYGKDNSSTKHYGERASAAGIPVNVEEYNTSDVVFASVNGNVSEENFNNTLQKVKKALDAGATVLTDSKEYLENSLYNKGEKRLADSLLKEGYIRKTDTNNSEVARWTKPVQSSPKPQPMTNPFYIDEAPDNVMFDDEGAGLDFDPFVDEGVQVNQVAEFMGSVEAEEKPESKSSAIEEANVGVKEYLARVKEAKKARKEVLKEKRNNMSVKGERLVRMEFGGEDATIFTALESILEDIEAYSKKVIEMDGNTIEGKSGEPWTVSEDGVKIVEELSAKAKDIKDNYKDCK
jgi:hypothetical protein